MKKCICGIISNEDGKILIQKHKKVDAYTLPGGKCDENEGDNHALIRELFEELGILVYRYEIVFTDIIKHCEYPAYSGCYCDFYHTYFKIEKFQGEIENREPEKHSELIWVKPEDIRKLGKISIVLDRYLENINL